MHQGGQFVSFRLLAIVQPALITLLSDQLGPLGTRRKLQSVALLTRSKPDISFGGLRRRFKFFGLNQGSILLADSSASVPMSKPRTHILTLLEMGGGFYRGGW